MSVNPQVIKVKTVEDFVGAASSLAKNTWVFRGHSSSKWPIISTMARYCKHHETNISKKWLKAREIESIRKFQKAAHQFLSHLPADDDLFGWLAVMRHYGAPTRLIDFTYSPVTALFFAVSGPYREFEKFTIHAINVDSVMQGACKTLDKTDDFKLTQDDFRIDKPDDQKKDFVGFFEGRWDSPRQAAQQGLFMVTSQLETDVHKLLMNYPRSEKGEPKASWIRYEFPTGRGIHKKAMKYLLTVNQTHASLYPGLEGLAQSLSMKLYEPMPRSQKYWADQ
jgi:hypothetical protein